MNVASAVSFVWDTKPDFSFRITPHWFGYHNTNDSPPLVWVSESIHSQIVHNDIYEIIVSNKNISYSNIYIFIYVKSSIQYPNIFVIFLYSYFKSI